MKYFINCVTIDKTIHKQIYTQSFTKRIFTKNALDLFEDSKEKFLKNYDILFLPSTVVFGDLDYNEKI